MAFLICLEKIRLLFYSAQVIRSSGTSSRPWCRLPRTTAGNPTEPVSVAHPTAVTRQVVIHIADSIHLLRLIVTPSLLARYPPPSTGGRIPSLNPPDRPRRYHRS
jgi:hypothetical protein